MATEFYHISGMHCISCAQTIEEIILQQKSAESVKVYFPLNLLILEHNAPSGKIYPALEQSLKLKGYGIKRININEIMQGPDKLLMNTIMRLCFVFLLGIFLHGWPMAILQYKILYPALVMLAILSFKYLEYMKNEVITKRLGMGTFLSIALTLTAVSFLLSLFKGDYNNAIHFLSSYAMILFFIEVGKSISELIRLRSFKGFLRSFSILDREVTVRNGDNFIEKKIGNIEKNDVIVVKAGENIYFDGVIVRGSSCVNEAIVTGEVEAVLKKEGDTVFSGSQNIDGTLQIQVSGNFLSSTLGIMQFYILKKLSEKTDTQVIMEKFLKYFIIIELVLVVVAMVYHYHRGLLYAIERASAIALLSCPCAFGIATPLVFGMAYLMSYKKKLLLTNPNILETVKDAKYLIIDKTGTITTQNITIKNYEFTENAQELMNLLYTLTKFSNHPKSVAITKFLEHKFNNITLLEEIKCENIPGKGLKATQNGVEYYLGSFSLLEENFNFANEARINHTALENYDIFFFTKEQLLAMFGMKEEIYDNVRESINNLKKHFEDVIILSGDKFNKVEECAREVGIETFYAEKTAIEKLAIIRKYKEGGKTIYIGDGINDALSLEEADIGISIGRAQDLAKSSADVILLDNNLENVLSLKKLSRLTVWAIKSNILWAIVYNVVFIPLGFGVFHSIHITPVLASILMSCSSLLLTVNSFLFLKFVRYN